MKTKILDLIDFEKVNTLLEGFNKTTGFLTAILDLEGNVLSKSGWRQICTEFHRVHPETSKNCTVSDTVLAGKMEEGEKYHFYKCLNGLVDVAVPIVIQDEHIANLFSGQFFFEEPDLIFFKKQAEKYGFDVEEYLKALERVPVVSQEKVKTAMDFLLNMTQLISEMTLQKVEQMELGEALKKSEEHWQFAIEGNGDGLWDWNLQTNQVFFSKQWKAMLGFNEDEIENKFDEWDKRVHPDDKIKAYDDIQKHLDGKTDDYTNEYRMVCKDGSYKWILDRGKIITRNSENKPFRFIGTHTDITDRKKAEKELQAHLQQEHFLADIIRNASVAVAVGYPDGKIGMCNQAFQKLTGYTEDELKDIQWNTVLTPAEWIQYETTQLEIINQTKKPVKYEKEYIHKNGHKIPIEANVNPFFDDKGNVTHYYGFITDLTERNQAEEAMRESEAKYKALYDNAPLSYQSLNEDGTFKDINPRWLFVLGYQREEVIGKQFFDFLHPESRKRAEQVIFPEFKRCGSITGVEFKIRHKLGHYIDISYEGCAGYNLDGSFKQTYCVFQDITSRKLAEEKLKESEFNYRDLFESSADGIIVLNEQSNILELNAQICEMLGYKREELVLINVLELLHVDDLMSKDHVAAMELLKQGKSILTQYRLRKKDGNYIPIELNTKMLGEGRFLNIVRDITERKLAEEALQESEEKFRSAFFTSPDAVNINRLDDGMYVNINDSFTQITGYTWEETIGKTSAEINIWTSSKDRAKLVAGLKENGKIENLEANFKLKDGRVIDGLMSATVISIGGVQHILSITRDVTERKLAEKALYESNLLIQNIIDNSPSLIYLSDTQGKFQLINRQFEILFQAKKDVLIGKSREDFMPIEIARQHRENDLEVIQSGKSITFEEENQEVDGKHFYLTQKFPLFDSNGKINSVGGISTDITELKIAQEAFKETAANLKSMIDNREDSIWSIDRNYNYIIFNSTYEKIINTQYNIKLKKGMSSSENLTKEEADFWIPQFESVFAGERITFEFSHKLNTGLRYFRTSLNPIIEGEIITGASGISIDITDRKSAEIALKLSEEKFEKSFRLSPYMVSLSSMDGPIVEVNEQVFDTFGYTRDEFIGKSTTELRLWIDQDERANFVTQLKQNGTLHEMDVQFRKKSGEIHDYLLSACIVKLNKENLLLSIIHDITERKQKEKALQESEERYRDLFENSHAIMLLIDTENGNIVSANPAASRFYGWSNTELVSMNISQINNLSKDKLNSVILQAVEENRKYFVIDHVLADQTIRNVEVYTAPILIKGKKHLYSIIHDVTDRIEAEEQIRKFNEELELLVIERTRELESANKDLEEINDLFVGREFRIIELKEELETLKSKLNLE